MKPTIRLAAAVVVEREDGQVLLVERNPKLRFFGGFVAFPGGVVGPKEVGGDEAEALRRCATRELFEETGILLGGSQVSADQRRDVRRALLEAEQKGESTDAFDRLVLRDGPALEPLCRILTPPFAPVRFDTQFFRVRLPAGESLEIVPGELVGGGFQEPKAALAAWVRGELRLVPPVLILLELLERAGTARFAEAATAVAEAFAEGVLPPVRFSPGVVLASLKTPTPPPAATTNTYIVGNERIYVIDPATPDEDEQDRLFTLIEGMQDAGRTLGGVLLTHHHPDHVGAVAALTRDFGVPVFAHPETFARLPVALDKSERFERIAIEDGHVFALGIAPDGTDGWQLQATHTPGHARGHLVFHENRYGATIVGDMISTVSTIVIDPPEGHMATYWQSLCKLLELPLTTLYPAHGPPALGGRRVVEQYLAHRKEREDKLIAAIGQGIGTETDLLPVVYDDVKIPAILPLAARSLAAGLEKLREDGRIEVVGGSFVVRA